ncbi:trypsin-like serine peptidase [Williamsia sterculiae]|uniref:Serine protease n=1 Tax=Williamsia sterculiae TaxID=1344003 RepID=A0A1N7FIP4_9NOCA|nr:hypothetical protein [Williamsia sterculiae]SIS00181.1 hypothetical protein SAMN05445060_2103 [Williamsia sterculiae]
MTDTVTGVPATAIPADIRALLDTVPGQESVALDPATITTGDTAASTEGWCPPWARVADPAAAVPFEVETAESGTETFYEPLVHEEPNPLVYPMCTVGIVFNSNNRRGSGVLVGPNLLLTAGHVAPWGSANWSMEFIPAYRNGNRPFGSSFVQTYHGYNANGSVTGYDYVICKLYQPLGRALGWMGSVSFGDDDAYYARRFVSSGYPGSYGERPAVELDMGVRDIDNDNPGLEVEFARRADLGPGWSGGPLWLPNEGPAVAGVLSGEETDGLDPRRLVYAAGRGLVDLVTYGQNTWPA